MHTRNIWVLGGTGFIGSALVKHLANDPLNRIHMLVHRNVPYRFMERFNTITGSIMTFDPQWFERYPPDVVFHLARPAGSRGFTRAWAARRGEKANRRLAGIIKSLQKPPVVVYVSGSLLYGPRPDYDPAVESSPLAPASFAAYYHQNEKPWIEAQNNNELDVRFARPGWITGPASWFEQFFWRPIMTDARIPCYGSGKQLMSLIHLDDGAAMIDALSRSTTRGQDLNVFVGKPITMRSFCEIISEITGMEIETIDEAALEKQMGKTVAQALTTSIPMGTLYPEMQKEARVRFTGHKELLTNVIGLLKNK